MKHSPGSQRRPGGCLVFPGFRRYLKSLSLEVIFSSRLEMWYEALAMSVAVSCQPPASAQCVCVSVCVSVRVSDGSQWCDSSGKVCVSGFFFFCCCCCRLSLLLQRLSHPGARSLVCLNGAPVLSLQRGGVSRRDAVGSEVKVWAVFVFEKVRN